MIQNITIVIERTIFENFVVNIFFIKIPENEIISIIIEKIYLVLAAVIIQNINESIKIVSKGILFFLI